MASAPALSAECQALLDGAACGLMRTCAEGKFLRVNRTFCRWVGYSEHELGERRFQDLLTMGGRIFHQTHWSPLLRMQGSISEVKLEVVHRDGSRVPMVVNAIRHDDDGVVVHDLAAFVARDRDKYERELVLSRKKLEELVAETTRLHAEEKDRALFAEQMIGIVSHDLRNPIATIQTGAALLERDLPAAQVSSLVARIARASERANLLITDLLDFTQARLSGGLSVSLQAFDLHQAVAEAVDELRLAYPDRAVEHQPSGSGPCRADINRLAQLVGNLVSNAMAYGSPAAPVTVQSSIDSDTFAIAVHNEGEPIAPSIRETLFQPMTRGTRTGSKRSVGLGLFIVSEITRAHAGRMLVDSTPTGGTTFRAVFPRQPPPLPNDPAR